jgi:DnaJ-domain-containing protein 1
MPLIFLLLVVFLVFLLLGRNAKPNGDRAARVVRAARRSLIEYLHSRRARRREYAQADAAAGQGRDAARGGEMTEQEAYQVLGLQPGASTDEISRAHRVFMKKLHPDQGGSTDLAARVNHARDVLLRGHR